MKWRDPLLTASAIFGLWTAYAISIAIQSHFHILYPNISAQDWTQTLKMHLSSRWIWVLFAPAIVLLTRRFPIAGASWKRHTLVHLVGFLVSSTATAALAKLLSPMLGTPPASWPLLIVWFMQLYYNFVSYLAVAAVAHAIEYYRNYRDGHERAAQLELEAARFESRMSRAKLEVLRSQIQPHFVFNTLHSISELIHENPVAADHVVTRLGDLLRMAVDERDSNEVPLRHELAFIDAYVEIQRTRLAGRLVFETVADPDSLEGRVPQMLLQPIVENAIEHGGARSDRCVIRLSASRRNGSLVIDVEDEGPGFLEDPPSLREGVGLSNTRARLHTLYGDAYRLELSNRPSGGAAVHMAIPFRRGPSHLGVVEPVA